MLKKQEQVAIRTAINRERQPRLAPRPKAIFLGSAGFVFVGEILSLLFTGAPALIPLLGLLPMGLTLQTLKPTLPYDSESLREQPLRVTTLVWLKNRLSQEVMEKLHHSSVRDPSGIVRVGHLHALLDEHHACLDKAVLDAKEEQYRELANAQQQVFGRMGPQ